MSEHRLEVADVFRTYGDDFLARWGHVLSRQQRKAFDDIRACRTAALGGHVEQCDQCGHCAISYNSCRNRSCPKCQAAARAKWLAERHIHCVVPGGGISPDNSRWIPCRRYRKSFFLPVKVLSRRFRKRFLIHLRRAFRKGKLQFHGELESIAQPAAFEALCRKAGQLKRVVYAKRPFGGPEQVLRYLARYTHRVAISNRRLLSLTDGRVAFEWKDYADGNQTKTMTLEAVEFIRRFLLHVLPSGFVHIRHFGFLANRKRKEKLALCRSLLSARQTVIGASAGSSSDGYSATQEPAPHRCPVCKTGRMIFMQVLTTAALDCLPYQSPRSQILHDGNDHTLDSVTAQTARPPSGREEILVRNRRPVGQSQSPHTRFELSRPRA
ncbi:hypothetical protein SBA6_890003 [Candidatus Sulfopaludibacter sp. SbA6]|nr:hypothetical protein SBA6_890003 [Candidatus Sulfopaludibacter sp. SbA6]